MLCVYYVLQVCRVVVIEIEFLLVLLCGLHVVCLMFFNWFPGLIYVYRRAKHENAFKASAIDVEDQIR